MVKSATPRLKPYQLRRGASDEPLALVRTWWTIPAIYLSDVCLAARVLPQRPEAQHQWDATDAKEDLYRLLRWIGQMAWEHNLARPVAGVAAQSDFRRFGRPVAEQAKGWGGEQDWHRGGFALYVESGGEAAANDRILDLIEPTPHELETFKPRNPRDTDTLLAEIRQHLPTRAPKIAAGHTEDLRSALDEWARAWGAEAATTGGVGIEESPLAESVETIVVRAERLAGGHGS
jgi:hypothetical protein